MPIEQDWKETRLEKYLLEELKLVQGKIDKIGEFVFKIRTWAVTANAGLVLAVLSTVSISNYSLWIGAFATLVFWRLEVLQRRISDSLSERALCIEDALAKFSEVGVNPKLTIEIASELALHRLRTIPGIAKACRASIRGNNSAPNDDWLYATQLGFLTTLFIWFEFRNSIVLFAEAAMDVAGVLFKGILQGITCS